jgi:hypothetical protein
MLFFVVVSPQALLSSAVASYGEAGYFNIEWHEYLKEGSQEKIAQSEIPFILTNCTTEMDSQHPVFIFGRVFVFSMCPGPAFIAIHPQRVL